MSGSTFLAVLCVVIHVTRASVNHCVKQPDGPCCASGGSCETRARGNTRGVEPKFCDMPSFVEECCGNGVCGVGETPFNCFEDCYSYAQRTPTSKCPKSPIMGSADAAAEKPRLHPGYPLGEDTIGKLISNQYLWDMPGASYMANGFNFVTGEPTEHPIFEYSYCQGDEHTLKNLDRGLVYGLPDQLDATPYPKCDFTTDTRSYKSSAEMASEMAEETNVAGSVTVGYSGEEVSASATVSFSGDKSVQRARESTTESSNLVTKTKVHCASHRAALNRQEVNFNLYFLTAIAGAFNDGDFRKMRPMDRLVDVIKKHGLFYYAEAVLGGELSLTSSHETSKLTTHDSEEHASAHAISFSTKASGYGFSASASGSYAHSTSGSSDKQNSFEQATKHTAILARGGAPGSFGPSITGSGSDEAPMTWGAWAQTVDLTPWPIDYTVDLIENLFDDRWAFSRAGCPYELPDTVTPCYVKEAWHRAGESYLSAILSLQGTQKITQGRYLFQLTTGEPVTNPTSDRIDADFAIGLAPLETPAPSAWEAMSLGRHPLVVQRFWDDWMCLPKMTLDNPDRGPYTFDVMDTLYPANRVSGIKLFSRSSGWNVKEWHLFSPDAQLSWTGAEEVAIGEGENFGSVKTLCPDTNQRNFRPILWLCVDNKPSHTEEWKLHDHASFLLTAETSHGMIKTEINFPVIPHCFLPDDQNARNVRNTAAYFSPDGENVVASDTRVRRMHVRLVRRNHQNDQPLIESFRYKLLRAAVRLPCKTTSKSVPTVFSAEMNTTITLTDPNPTTIEFPPHPQSFVDRVKTQPKNRTWVKPPQAPLRCHKDQTKYSHDTVVECPRET